jgi:uncharacterized membrane protein YidH (DUF202 family)
MRPRLFFRPGGVATKNLHNSFTEGFMTEQTSLQIFIILFGVGLAIICTTFWLYWRVLAEKRVRVPVTKEHRDNHRPVTR